VFLNNIVNEYANKIYVICQILFAYAYCVVLCSLIYVLCFYMYLFVYVDQLFLILYKELYYRHVYARVQVICVAFVLLICVELMFIHIRKA